MLFWKCNCMICEMTSSVDWRWESISQFHVQLEASELGILKLSPEWKYFLYPNLMSESLLYNKWKKELKKPHVNKFSSLYVRSCAIPIFTSATYILPQHTLIDFHAYGVNKRLKIIRSTHPTKCLNVFWVSLVDPSAYIKVT